MTPSAYRIEPLQRQHDRKSFSCGSAELDRYLAQQARQDAEKHVAAPFVLVDSKSATVLGYYTLSAAVLNADELPPGLAKKLPRYGQLPVTLLGRLAVDQRLRARGMGEFMLLDALHRSLEAAAGIAAMAVVVDAKDESAASFYRHFSFASLQKKPARLFLPMKSVALLFA